MRGRKPIPTHLRLLDGNASHRPLPVGVVTPANELPQWPADLPQNAIAMREFDRLARELAKMGAGAAADSGMLAAYCLSFARLAHAEAALGEDPRKWILETPSGYSKPSPYLAIVSRSTEQMRQIAEQFGFTPAARTRVKTMPGQGETNGDPIDEVMAG